MTNALCYWQNCVSLCPASFCTQRPSLPVTPGMSWLLTFPFQSPITKRTSSLGLSSRRLVGLHRTVQLQLLQHYWLWHKLSLPWYWMVCFGNQQSLFCHFLALTIRTFISKVRSLLFNVLYRFLIAFLQGSNHFLISWLQSPSTVILEPRKGKLSLLPPFPLLFAIKGKYPQHYL